MTWPRTKPRRLTSTVSALAAILLSLPALAVVPNGLFLPSTDSIGMATSSTERVRIDSSGKVGIGTTNPSAILDISGTSATTSALIIPRSTLATRPSGVNGMIRYNLDSQKFEGFAANAWSDFAVGVGGSSQWTTSGADIYYSVGRVGVGTTAPGYPISVVGAGSQNYHVKTTDSAFDSQAGVIYEISSGVALTGLTAVAGRMLTTSVAGEFIFNNRVGPIIFSADSSYNRKDVYVATDGKIGIGTTSPGSVLDVNGDINISSTKALRIGGTSVCTSAGCTSVSDKTLKENIRPLRYSLEKVLRLRGVEYEYKDKQKFTSLHQIGIIAQDVEEVFPEVVVKDPETQLRAVAYDHLVAPLIEALKTLYQRITNIEHREAMRDREIASVEASVALNIETLKARAEEAEKENLEMKARIERLEKTLKFK